MSESHMAGLTFDEASHTYRVNGFEVPHITQIIPSDFSMVPPKVLEKARQRGHAVHKACELYDLGTLDWATLDPQVEPYLEAWIKAKKEYEITFAPEDIELLLYHPVYGYAGTGDRPRCVVRNVLSTLEIKSVANMGPETGLQTAGQRLAINYNAQMVAIAPTVNRWGFQLKRNGTFKPVQYIENSDDAVFLAYLKTLKWEIKHGKRNNYTIASNAD